jgi:hypothetical protein
MGGVCSRKRDQRDNEDNVLRGVSGRYFKSGSSKWLATSFSRPAIDVQLGRGKCPSLLDLCIRKICEVIFYSSSCLSLLVSWYSSKKTKKESLLVSWLISFASFSNRTLMDIAPFQCSQGILVSRSLMS